MWLTILIITSKCLLSAVISLSIKYRLVNILFFLYKISDQIFVLCLMQVSPHHNMTIHILVKYIGLIIITIHVLLIVISHWDFCAQRDCWCWYGSINTIKKNKIYCTYSPIRALSVIFFFIRSYYLFPYLNDPLSSVTG